MSVVGLTPGTAAKASRPTTASAAMAATSATVRAGGWHYSTETARVLGGAGDALTPELKAQEDNLRNRVENQ